VTPRHVIVTALWFRTRVDDSPTPQLTAHLDDLFVRARACHLTVRVVVWWPLSLALRVAWLVRMLSFCSDVATATVTHQHKCMFDSNVWPHMATSIYIYTHID
jgi:hypothetical protein